MLSFGGSNEGVFNKTEGGSLLLLWVQGLLWFLEDLAPPCETQIKVWFMTKSKIIISHQLYTAKKNWLTCAPAGPLSPMAPLWPGSPWTFWSYLVFAGIIVERRILLLTGLPWIPRGPTSPDFPRGPCTNHCDMLYWGFHHNHSPILLVHYQGLWACGLRTAEFFGSYLVSLLSG